MPVSHLSFLLAVTYSPIQQPDSSSRDSLRQHQLQEIVVSASRVSENLLRSPVSIEVLDFRRLRNAAQPSYFDAIEHLKGVQTLTSSLGFRVYNTRGFANPTNVRFVQLVDGIDNQAPHIGAPIAAALAPSDLDIRQVEIIPGTASALYGLNALNGLANLLTLNPFDAPGLSMSQKTAVNHLGTDRPGLARRGPRLYSESSLRFARRVGNRLAFKLNLVYQAGYDWIANTAADLNPQGNASLGLFGADNPAADPVNSYGNESSNRRALTVDGKRYSVARTGYFEEETTDYRLRNLRGDLALHYRIRPQVELAYVFRAATLDNVYQRTNRFRLDDYRLSQHVLTLNSPSVQLKAYRSSENTGDSYNIRSMSENIDRAFKSDNQWFADFSRAFQTGLRSGTDVNRALVEARGVADAGRPQPGTEAFASQVEKLRNINNWDEGAALRVQSWMYHAEGQIEPTRVAWSRFRERTGLNLLAGFDYRLYEVFPDGNYFINPVEPERNLLYYKFGGFVQVNRLFFEEKLKVSSSLRLDKNRYFEPRLNPRLSLVFSPTEAHHFRLSFQNGYRFPSLFEAFSNVNSGGVKRVGGLPIMSQGIFEKSYLRTSIDAFQAAITNDVNVNRLTTAQAIRKNEGLLRPNTYTYLKPEQVNSLEIGYKALLAGGRLFVDADAYYNIYRNFMAQVEANIPRTSVADSVPFYLADRARQDRYRLWTNSRTTVYNYGASLGLRYSPDRRWTFSGNVSLAQLDRKAENDGLEEAFNTPKWIANLSVGNAAVWQQLGFQIAYKHQSAFLWQSALATGTVPSIHTFDAQISYPLGAVRLKLGGTNLLNRPYLTFYGAPNVGGFYYLTVTFS